MIINNNSIIEKNLFRMIVPLLQILLCNCYNFTKLKHATKIVRQEKSIYLFSTLLKDDKKKSVYRDIELQFTLKPCSFLHYSCTTPANF